MKKYETLIGEGRKPVVCFYEVSDWFGVQLGKVTTESGFDLTDYIEISTFDELEMECCAYERECENQANEEYRMELYARKAA